MSDCPECRRPFGVHNIASHCSGEGSDECAIAAVSYRRGITDMLAVAKRYAYGGHEVCDHTPVIWTDVEREAAKLAGEGR